MFCCSDKILIYRTKHFSQCRLILLFAGFRLPWLAISPYRAAWTGLRIRTDPQASRKESCQENVSQVRKHVVLTINPELIHATLEAIRYSRRTVRGICAARAPAEEKEIQKERGGGEGGKTWWSEWGKERKWTWGRGGRARNALLVNPVASHAHMQRPKIVISRDITRRPTPSHRTCFIPGAAINHAVFNKLRCVGSRNNTHIRREFTRTRAERECHANVPAILAFFFFYYASSVALFYFFFSFNHCLSQSRAYGILRLEGMDRTNGGQGGMAMDYLPPPPHGFAALFRDDRHWRVNHCNTTRVRMCLNLTKYVTVWFAVATKYAFRNVFFSTLFFILECMYVHCSISSDISLRAVNTNFYGYYCAIFMVAIVQSPNSIICRINMARLME